MASQLFRPKVAAARLGISLSQFWLLVKSGKLSTFKNGGMTFVTDDEITRYISTIVPKNPSKRRAA